MLAVNFTAGASLSGEAAGVTGNPEINAGTGITASATFTQNGTAPNIVDQIIDKGTTTVTLAAGTTTINLQSFTNHLNETGQSMARVRVLYFDHDSTSAAASVTVFNAAANSFQGPLSAGAAEVLLPGDRFDRVSLSAAGWAVDGTHNTLSIVVAGGTATLRYVIAGSSA